MTGPRHLRVEIEGGVATVTLNRPEVHNAFNEEVVIELTAAFAAIATDASVRVTVLTGEGKSFSAGADLHWMKRMVEYSREENLRDADAMAEMFATIDRHPKPVIAKIRGAAIGGGTGLVAVADIPIAAEGTCFAFSEARLGIAPAVISPYVLARIGAAHARRYFLSGERFDAARASAIGLISEVVPADKLDERVTAVAQEIARCGPEAVTASKRLIFDLDSTTPATARALTAELIATLRASAEGQEGMQSFLDKRSPSWIDEAN